MSILTKNMEMPKFLLGGQIAEIFSVQGSITVYPNGEAKLDILLDKHRETHRLVPIPPHGRLIDADALCELCDIMVDKCDGIGESIWHQFRATVEWTPTIIPASFENPTKNARYSQDNPAEDGET